MLWHYEIYLPDQRQLGAEGSIEAPDFVEARDRALHASFIEEMDLRKYDVRLLNQNGNTIWIGRYQNAAEGGNSLHRSRYSDAA